MPASKNGPDHNTWTVKDGKTGGWGLETKSGTLALGLKSAVNLPIPSDDSAPMALQCCSTLPLTIRCPAIFAPTGALYITMRQYPFPPKILFFTCPMPQCHKV